MAANAWALPLLLLALSGCGALQCQREGRFWDGCNWCYCHDRVVVGCTNMACLEQPGADLARFDPNRATIGPPRRVGMSSYKPGRGTVVDSAGWPCQLGSSWLEEDGCVRCICANKMIKCRDSGRCLNGEPVTNELNEYVRRRRDSDSAPAADPAPSAAALEAVAVEAAAPAAEQAAATEATESTTATAWAATEAAAATTATAGIAEVAETTMAPAGGDAAAVTPATNATQPTGAPLATTTAQNTVVKDRSCRSGSTWEEDCNSCWCLDNGRAACTTNSCEAPLPLAAPGSSAAVVAGGAGAPNATPANAGLDVPAAAVPAAPAPTTLATPTAAAPAAAAASPGVVQAAVSSSSAAPEVATDPAPAVAEPAAAGGAVAGVTGSRRKRRVLLVGA